MANRQALGTGFVKTPLETPRHPELGVNRGMVEVAAAKFSSCVAVISTRLGACAFP